LQKIKFCSIFTTLENKCNDIFLKLSDKELNLMKNQLKLLVEKVPNDCQDESLGWKTDSRARGIFDKKLIKTLAINL